VSCFEVPEYGRNKEIGGATVSYHEVPEISEMRGYEGLPLAAASCNETA
jgi:hypothetical protein